MEFTATDIAELIDGRIEGDASTKVNQLAKIEEGVPQSLSFLANEKYIPFIYDTKASIVIVNDEFKPERNLDLTLIYVNDAYQAFGKLLQHYNNLTEHPTQIEENSQIHQTANLGNNVYIGSFTYLGKNVSIGNHVKIYPQCYIGDNVRIADGSILYPGVKIYSDCVLGENCMVHSNAVIGSDGFGFSPNPSNGSFSKVPQIGNVIIEDDVEIGAGCTIDRATLGSTTIKKGVKLDNQIQIAHNVVIGKNSVIASQTGIAGSTKIGQNAMIGGQVGISGHLNLGNRIQIQAQSGINNTIKDDEKVYGSPAIPANDFRKSYVLFRKFPKLVKRIENLEKILKIND